MKIVSQLRMKPEIPTIYGPQDYRVFRSQLQEIDSLLCKSGIEEQFLLETIEKDTLVRSQYNALKSNNQSIRPCNINKLSIALRTNILASLLCESYRSLSFRIADSTLCQWFIGIDTPVGGKTPSKSSIKRYEQMWSKEEIALIIHKLNKALSEPISSMELINSEIPLDFTRYYADSTCIESNIHHPVDWVLLRDAVRTIIAAIKTIRKQGLFHRIGFPDSFLTEVNTLSMAMTEASRNRSADGKKKQKLTFRKMKRLLRTVEKHGNRYAELLKKRWAETSWSKVQMELVLSRISNITEQIDTIISLAHNRIIRGEVAPNALKVLSLYEKNVHVIKRGKAQGEVEFGNGFYIAEQENGMIVDWDHFQYKQKSDAKILKESIERIKQNFTVESFTTDRGFNSKNNSTFLAKSGIYDATCPKIVLELEERLKEPRFRIEQKRRAQTEGRIGILKNKFIKGKIKRKGFENRNTKILWSIFTHNIWVAARLSLANEKELIKIKAA